jgi:hypothetical protein
MTTNALHGTSHTPTSTERPDVSRSGLEQSRQNLLLHSAKSHPTSALHGTGCRHFFDATVVAAAVTDLHASGRRTGAASCQTSSAALARGSTRGSLLALQFLQMPGILAPTARFRCFPFCPGNSAIGLPTERAGVSTTSFETYNLSLHGHRTWPTGSNSRHQLRYRALPGSAPTNLPCQLSPRRVVFSP